MARRSKNIKEKIFEEGAYLSSHYHDHIEFGLANEVEDQQIGSIEGVLAQSDIAIEIYVRSIFQNRKPPRRAKVR